MILSAKVKVSHEAMGEAEVYTERAATYSPYAHTAANFGTADERGTVA